MVAALGDGIDELVSLLAPWGHAIREAGGYPLRGRTSWRRSAEQVLREPLPTVAAPLFPAPA
jgi:hypothetical protein